MYISLLLLSRALQLVHRKARYVAFSIPCWSKRALKVYSTGQYCSLLERFEDKKDGKNDPYYHLKSVGETKFPFINRNLIPPGRFMVQKLCTIYAFLLFGPAWTRSLPRNLCRFRHLFGACGRKKRRKERRKKKGGREKKEGKRRKGTKRYKRGERDAKRV